MKKLEKSIREILDGSGIGIYGFADLSDILKGGYKEYTHAVSIAVRLNPSVVKSILAGPNQEYCEEYKNVNKELDRVSAIIEQEISDKGYKAKAIAASKRTDFERILGEFPHKTAATRAGIGWIGKSSLLVTKRYGPRIRLSTILTDYPLEAALPVEKNYCGRCTQCIEMCPAAAIVGGEWIPGVERGKLLMFTKVG